MSSFLEFHGAAKTVTGSMHLVQVLGQQILLDAGLYQGRRQEAFDRNRNLTLDPQKLSAVVLSHAHIDHSGALPILTKLGYRGPIYMTPATRDLVAAMLEDAAMIQKADAKYVNKLISRGQMEGEPIEALYDEGDVEQVLNQTVSFPYNRSFDLPSGVSGTFYDAGHVLGSAGIALDVPNVGRVAFSGDVGRKDTPIIRDPALIPRVRFLLMESTYGNRVHPKRSDQLGIFKQVINRTLKRGGKVIVPTFALERAQEVLYALSQLRAAGEIPECPIYVDSPLTVRLTEVFKLHPDCYDQDAKAHLAERHGPFDFPGVRYVGDVAESREVSESDGPAIVLAASGMCESGRIVHHLQHGIGNPKNTVMIVGFQAPHTLGRRLVEKRHEVRIFGVPRQRECEVEVVNGFSAHAGQDELLAYAENIREHGELERVFLVHGEPTAQQALSELLQARKFEVTIPSARDRFQFPATN